ncbi:MAG: hypothetical protein ACETWR_12460 [Anaerolineae bacterium]
MRKSNLSYETGLLRILAVLCLLSSYLWIAPSQVHALSAGFQEYDVLGDKEQTYVTGGATADTQMVYYDSLSAPIAVSASAREQTQPQTVGLSWEDHLWPADPFQTDNFSLSVSKGDVPQASGESDPSMPVLDSSTTLTVSIISSPWAILDHNNPETEGPHAFVVEAVITNTGSTTATGVVVNLDYNEDPPVNNWVLLEGEDPERTLDDDEPLAAGEAYHAFWFATYTSTIGLGHEYTVTAWATNAMTVTTSDNYYENPGGKTVQTRAALEGGSTRQEEAVTDIVVGVAFTFTVKWDLGTNFDKVLLSPVGNVDFHPGSYRLVASRITFLDGTTVLTPTVHDRLYFPTVPSEATHAQGEFIFMALRPTVTSLCPYCAPLYSSNFKYDNEFCQPVIPLTGTISVSLTKQASSLTVQHNQPLTYTIYYTNSGSLPLQDVWVWDDVDTAMGSIITASIDPLSHLGETTDSRVAWYLGDVPQSGQPYSTGTLTFTIRVDGGGQALPDGTHVVNHAFLGINPGSLPHYAALTSTAIITVEAPVLTISKSDSPDPVLTGGLITYTLHYTNSGSVAATSVLITDRVPLSTTYQTCSGGSVCGMSNGVVSWTIGTVLTDTTDTVGFSVLVSDTLETGTLIRNEDYGIVADETNFVSGPLVTTQVNSKAGFIDGYTFIDADCDGSYGAGEGPLSDITVTLNSATVPVMTTDVDGYYLFRVEVEGPISVTADLPTGYFYTKEPTVFTDTVLGITQTINFGYAPITSTCGVIYGTVFDDANHDKIRLNEKGLSGVEVASAEAATSPVTTDQYGRYTLGYDTSGPVTITETNPPFYVSTTPDVVPTNAVIGSSGPSPIDFGDFLGIKVTGQVFNDANVNSVNDAEAGVPGATVTADGDSFATGSSGVYTLYVTVSDSNPILVSETDPAGYLSTNAVPGSNMSKVDANTLHIGGPISGYVYYGDFGDVWAGAVITISGQVWNDNGAGGGELANGLRDGTEPGLAGAIVSLSSGLTQTTTSDGLFLRYAPPGQVITVTETNPTDYLYLSTDAIAGNDATKWDKDTLIVNAPSGGSISANNLFGDVLASEVMADIIVVKEASVDTALVGETITYTYRVTNTGNVTLNSVTLNDDRLGPITLGSTSLVQGAGTSGTYSYVVQQSDMPGPLTNTAMVTGTLLVGGVVTDTDSESVALSIRPIYLPIILKNH